MIKGEKILGMILTYLVMGLLILLVITGIVGLIHVIVTWAIELKVMVN